MIKTTFAETAAANKLTKHGEAVDAVNRWASEQQRGSAGQTEARDVDKKIVDTLTNEVTGEKPSPEKVASVRKALDNGKFEVIESSWPGRDLFSITHINGAIILKMNNRHPILAAYRSFSDAEATGNKIDLLAAARRCIDSLLLGYAKAESFDREPEEKYSNLRTFWGAYSAQYFEKMEADIDRGKS